ncbi:DUF742 domain-containing protein [Kitasatospora sp. MAP5-34]|uniref:DUF742 domain-containing protein n=1 Tax=Kitasatospora sp. MAP5-34 TaxID=3035102 RepID=UPI002473FA7B|nr:DUF742 domain-containing protein [Kitasatospora sp. MAP5-34]MDH6579887.1 hypothetical protein [Kitasatospora sp. MAP5-34]
MTPPDDRSGQYGVPYPGTGHDAFGAPGVGPGQPYEQLQHEQQQYAQQQYGQQQHQQYQHLQGQQQYGQQPQPYGQQQPPQQHQQQYRQDTRQDLGGYRTAPGRRGPESFPVQPAEPDHGEEPGYLDDYDDEQDSGPLIRPFAMTGGRTRPRYELALEALVSANVAPDRLATMLPEHQRICTLCTEVKSVAEVSALLNIPLGVARILVADLAEAGLVAIHQPAAGGESGNQPDVTLLERVLSGLRNL